jgi:hypothetical protein
MPSSIPGLIIIRVESIRPIVIIVLGHEMSLSSTNVPTIWTQATHKMLAPSVLGAILEHWIAQTEMLNPPGTTARRL